MEYLKSFRKVFLFYAITIFFSNIIISCPYGAFDINKPQSSSLSIMLNGNDISSEVKSGIYTINMDTDTSGYLILSAYHYKDNKNKNYPFTWKCNTLHFIEIENGEHSIGIDIKNDGVLGFHTLIAYSSVDSSLNQSISLNIISDATKINVNYSLDESSVSDQIDYNLYKSGIVTENNSTIALIAGAKYLINVSSSNNSPILNCTFDINSNLTSYGVPYIHSSSLVDDSNTTLVLETESEETSSQLPSITVTNSSTLANITLNIKTIRLIKADIEDIENTESNTSFISLEKDGGVKQYTISLKGSLPIDKTLFGYLPYATTTGTNAKIEEPEADDNLLGWSSNKKFSAYYENEETNLPYFALEFDGINYSIAITPYRNTITQYGENINFFFYIKDITNTIVGKWKILVGGAIERIDVNILQINEKVGNSGSIKASVYPEQTDSSVLWYISEQPYQIANDDKTIGKYIKIAPPPSENIYTKSLLMLLSQNKDQVGTEYNASKVWNLKFENYPYELGKRKNMYYETLASIPLMIEGTSELLYSIGNKSGSFYIVALAESTDYKVFKSIPVSVSSEGSITIQSETGVSPVTYIDNKKVFYDTYVNENNEECSLPMRVMQSYPDTAENNIFGVNTRTFYFPHNKISTLNIETLTSQEGTFEWSTSSEADSLFSIVENKNSNSIVLKITPQWLTYNKRALQDSTVLYPPQSKNDHDNKVIEAYGNFNDFIGIAYINFSLGKTYGKLRIVIYDANIYQ